MKVFVSSDIEGSCGIAHFDETDDKIGGRWYEYFSRQMSREVAAACEGALAAGADGILVKDAHDTARNIDPSLLPQMVQINRGWNGGLFSMVAGLSKSFDAVAFTGYHSPAYGSGNPLSHTMHQKADLVTINGTRASEFIIHSYCAALVGVPVVFVSGDGALCREAKQFLPAITAVAVSEGEGNASTSPHPDVAVQMIKSGMEQALSGDLSACLVELPKHFSVQVRYATHPEAYSMSFYPGAALVDEKTLLFETDDYYEVMRFFHFVLW